MNGIQDLKDYNQFKFYHQVELFVDFFHEFVS